MKQIIETTRSVLQQRSSLAIFTGLYALLLGALYGFIATKDAKLWQVLLTLLFVAGAPVLFFLLQAAIINSARAGRIAWSVVLRDSCRLALLALPLILIGVGIMYLLNRWQAHFPTPQLARFPPAPGKPLPTLPTHWPTVLFAMARTLIFVIALPLAMIHLWVEVGNQNLITFVRSGPRRVLKSLGLTLARAFALESVFTYSLGLIVFGLIPYVLLFVRVPLGGTWREVGVFSARLLLGFVFTLVGWVLTLSAFARANDDVGAPIPAPSEGTSTEGEAQPPPSTTVAA